jgi:hypothetical protein
MTAARLIIDFFLKLRLRDLGDVFQRRFENSATPDL